MYHGAQLFGVEERPILVEIFLQGGDVKLSAYALGVQSPHPYVASECSNNDIYSLGGLWAHHK
jgi:hypothetical protein